mgnify:CR=1 FL=1
MAGDNEHKQWYSNKDLFEMMQGLKKELAHTRTDIRKYNGLRKDLDFFCSKTKQNENNIVELQKNQNSILKTLKQINWVSIIVGGVVITAIVTALLNNIGL